MQLNKKKPLRKINSYQPIDIVEKTTTRKPSRELGGGKLFFFRSHLGSIIVDFSQTHLIAHAPRGRFLPTICWLHFFLSSAEMHAARWLGCNLKFDVWDFVCSLFTILIGYDVVQWHVRELLLLITLIMMNWKSNEIIIFWGWFYFSMLFLFIHAYCKQLLTWTKTTLINH